jgi:hypothetical protein
MLYSFIDHISYQINSKLGSWLDTMILIEEIPCKGKRSECTIDNANFLARDPYLAPADDDSA